MAANSAKFQDFMQNKVGGMATKMAQNKVLQSIQQGMIATLPFLILGSFSSIIVNFPYAPFTKFLQTSGLTPYLNIPYQLTMGTLALYVAFFTAKAYSDKENVKSNLPAIMAVLSLLMLSPLKVFPVKGPQGKPVPTSFIPFDNIGVKGLFLGLILAIVVSWGYCKLINSKWTIKMPDGVPATIATSFKALVPVVVIAIAVVIVKYLMALTPYGDLNSAIYALLQVPLQKIGTSPWAILLVVVLNSLFFYFGIHSLAINSIVMPILYALDFQNLAAFNAGHALPNMITWRFFYMTSKIGGTGCTLGLVIFMAFFAKSKQFKMLGRLSILPVIFNTDEPVIFGMPIALNPIMFVPFVLAPVVSFLGSYACELLHIVKPVIGLAIPEQTPVIISGLLQSGPAFAIMQAVMVVITALIFLPFAKIADNQALANEQAAAKDAK